LLSKEQGTTFNLYFNKSDETPPAGSEVEVHYTGTLTNGTKFDSSRDRDETFKFTLGASEVIQGWDIGVASMKRGERSTFTLTSEYAYGSRGAGADIPPNATLVFDVELIDWQQAPPRPSQNMDQLQLLQMLMQQQQLQKAAQQTSTAKSSGTKCQLCAKPASSKCSRCHSVAYCSKDCQVKDWSSHKTVCSK
jgi:hypothetical protein